MSTVISIENVSKSYRLGMIGGATLKEDVSRWWARMRRRPDPLLKVGEDRHMRRIGDQFWALQDVSFRVKEGEVLGIIGRNGAGKSTLLKILSQVTAPTSGEVKIKGRIASLLEVGTGFHPELTGRENIFLNGAILGMTKNEIRRKYDEIIAFSGIEEFIDTPVKRYSSGMYVRLAFAVAAHLEPDILIVDEVLAVGDTAFQRKCLGKMQEVSAERGRTVLFVSHNMAAIQTLCKNAVLFQDGEIADLGPARQIVDRYLSGDEETNSGELATRKDRLGSGALRFTKLRFLNNSKEPTDELISGEPATIQFAYTSFQELDATRLTIAVSLWDSEHHLVALFASDEIGSRFSQLKASGVFQINIPKLLLRAGTYRIKVMLAHGSTAPEDVVDMIENCGEIRIAAGDFWQTGCTNREGSYSLIPASISND